MKNGKRPNRQQSGLMMAAGLSPLAWLVVKNLHDKMIVVHRESGEQREVAK